MSIEMYILISVPLWLITISSYPDNFLRLGRFGGFVFWGISTIGTMVVPAFHGGELQEFWPLCSISWLLIELVLAILCFAVPQGFSFRPIIGAVLRGEKVDMNQVLSERERAYRERRL